MFVQILETPNPSTMKFVTGVKMAPVGQSLHFDSASASGYTSSPLAAAVMAIPAVESMMMADDFVAVTRKDGGDWHTIKTLVVSVIIDHIMAGKEVFSSTLAAELAPGAASSASTAIDSDADPELIQHIKALIDEKVRPAVAQDGGDIDFVAFRGGTVYLRMRGACSGCPSSAYTLKNGIENMLRHYVPEVTSVEQWED